VLLQTLSLGTKLGPISSASVPHLHLSSQLGHHRYGSWDVKLVPWAEMVCFSAGGVLVRDVVLGVGLRWAGMRGGCDWIVGRMICRGESLVLGV
jgi:hypothetical protein